MAQQTQAARAGEAWTRFMTRFPTVEGLASASPAEVLRAWQGLGYNRRALNLWRAAGRIVTEFNGVVPADVATLETLPGVGPYTARAVAAFAYGVPVGAVDTNVRRVLGRIVAGDHRTLSAPECQRLADAAVPPDRPAAWTHALMDIGATLCRPGHAACEACPASPWCAYASGAASASRRSPGRGGLPPRPRIGASAPFPSTSRWLRGRIVDRLRAAPTGGWVTIAAPLGEHDDAAIDRAIRALADEGLLEIAPDPTPDGPTRVRLPIG